MPAPTIRRAQRCAVYTRKSLNDQWDKAFNSIASQREICAAYIKCQEHRSWLELPSLYDDTGQSGATMGRPALQKLLRDIECGEIDIVVVYKIDRLTRSLADFLRMMKAFERYQVQFVSVTQAFDTSDSMGRLLLNILLTFAEFERELIADRVRDKVAAIKRRGQINGGRAPYGFDIVNGRLVVNAEEAEQVRTFFRRYIELGSCQAVAREAQLQGLRAKTFVTKRGVAVGGGQVSNGMIRHILQNPVCIGRVPHNGDSYPGEHEAIVDDQTWNAAQRLTASRRKFGPMLRQPRNVLKGLLRDSHGRRIVITTSGVKSLRYYTSESTEWAREHGISRYRVRADYLEPLVVGLVRDTLLDRETVRAALRDLGRRGQELNELCGFAAHSVKAFEYPRMEQLRELLRSLVVEGEISDRSITLEFRSLEVARLLAWDGIGFFEGDRAAWDRNAPSFTVRRELHAESRSGRRFSLPTTPAKSGSRRTRDPALIAIMDQARSVQAVMDGGYQPDLASLAVQFRCSQKRLCRLLKLNYLAPDIVSAIRTGTQPRELTFKRLIDGPLPLDWDLQRRVLGFS